MQNSFQLTRPDYYTKPALLSLTPDESGDCWVTGFTVYRRNYGSIHWPGRLNLARLDLDVIGNVNLLSLISLYLFKSTSNASPSLSILRSWSI